MKEKVSFFNLNLKIKPLKFIEVSFNILYLNILNRAAQKRMQNRRMVKQSSRTVLASRCKSFSSPHTSLRIPLKIKNRRQNM